MWRVFKKNKKPNELQQQPQRQIMSQQDANSLLHKFKYCTLIDLVFRDDENTDKSINSKEMLNTPIKLKSNIVLDENGIIKLYNEEDEDDEQQSWQDEDEEQLEKQIYEQMYDEMHKDLLQNRDQQQYDNDNEQEQEQVKFKKIPITIDQDNEWETESEHEIYDDDEQY